MQISSSTSSIGGYGAMRGMYGSPPDMDEMDAKVSQDIFSAKDADKSGSLSASELGISSDQLKTADTDGDGSLSASELTAALKAKREKMQAGMANQLMQDGQMGMLQASMGQGGMGQSGMGMGSVDMEEMDAKVSSDIFSAKDADKSGTLSASELGISADKFKAADTDGDGSLSSSELTASLKANREKMMAENGGRMPPPPGGMQGASGEKPSVDNLISGLFSDSDTSSTDSSTTSSTSSTLTGSLADILLRQKATNAYRGMDRLIQDLFGETSDSQSLAATA